MQGHSSTVEVLFRCTAFDQLCPSDDEVALFVAAAIGDVDQLCKLVAKNADLEFASRDGTTALFYAAEFGRNTAVQHLIDNGACVTDKQHAVDSQTLRECETPLTLAGRGGHLEIFEALVRAGVSVNVRSPVNGEAPLISVARVDNFPAVSLLIAHGNGTGVLYFEDFQDGEYSLLPGTLKTMETMCTAATFEFEPMCAHMMAQLQTMCLALQQQHQRRQEQLQDWSYALTTDQTPSSEHSAALVTFASIEYRACRLLFDIETKRTVLSRFVASRAIHQRIGGIDAELSSFARMYGLALGEAASAAIAFQSDDNGDFMQLQQQVQSIFEQTLSSDDMLVSGRDIGDAYSTFETAVLLQYELALRRREQSPHAQASVVEVVLARFLRVHKMETAPDVPVWFISRDDLEYHSWNLVKIDIEVERYAGKWQGAAVTIEKSKLAMAKFVGSATQWYALNHPNVAKLLGACHIGWPILFMYESTHGDLPLHKFLRVSETTEFAIKHHWKKKNTLPPLPASMTPKQRNLLELMTTFEPTKRVGMAFVLNKLNEITIDENVTSQAQ